MTLTALTAYLANYILQRPELATDQQMVMAVNAGHLQLQQDGDFRCMEAHAALLYTANTVEGIALPADYKRLRHVWNAKNGAVTDDVVTADRTSPITPATESEINLYALMAKQTRGLDSQAGQGYFMRWYERELKLCLVPAPTADTYLVADYYKFLPDYVVGGDSDYFSNYYWTCLLYAAAWQASVTFFEDSRAATFQQTYSILLKQAIANDQGIKEGGKKTLTEPTGQPTGGK